VTHDPGQEFAGADPVPARRPGSVDPAGVARDPAIVGSMSRPTLRHVAVAAGVHPATASRALNPQTRRMVNDETASRVIRIARQLGYRPNPIARSLKTARSASVGLVIPDLTNPLFPPIVRGVETVLGAAGYNAWIVNTDNDPVRETALVESLRSRHVEGLIVATARLVHPYLEQLAADGLPMVLVNRRMAHAQIPSVTADDAAGVELAVRHLVQLGHRRIAHVAGPQDTSTGLTRLRAFRHALRDHALAEDPDLVAECASWTEVEGATAMRRLVDSGVAFTAVLAGNDLLALGCYDALAACGIRCPAEISVVGFNDIPFVDKVDPPLTTVRIPHQAIGAEAAQMLLERLSEPRRHARSVVLPLTLVVRRSTAALPGGRRVPGGRGGQSRR
jgi:LacI family transcriptional regulator